MRNAAPSQFFTSHFTFHISDFTFQISDLNFPNLSSSPSFYPGWLIHHLSSNRKQMIMINTLILLMKRKNLQWVCCNNNLPTNSNAYTLNTKNKMFDLIDCEYGFMVEVKNLIIRLQGLHQVKSWNGLRHFWWKILRFIGWIDKCERIGWNHTTCWFWSFTFHSRKHMW